MHEMSITLSLLDIVREHMERHGVERLLRLRIKVGELTAVEAESLRFCFDASVKDTALEGAALEIEEVPLTGRCRECGREFRIEGFFAECPGCGSSAVDQVAGRELDIVSMEVE